jgi:PAS domain-containing protein
MGGLPAVGWDIAVALPVTAVLAALAGIVVLALLRREERAEQPAFGVERAGALEFLFDGEVLVDATPAARRFLSDSPIRGGAWARLMARLGPEFPELERHILALPGTGQFRLEAGRRGGPPMAICGEIAGGLTRLSLIEGEGLAAPPDAAAHLALEREAGQLREVAARVPVPLWRERRDGEVIWANAAYLALALARLEEGQELTWPLPRVFDRRGGPQPGAAPLRLQVSRAGEGPAWFDLHAVAEQEEGARLMCALPADRLVAAEGSLRDFMQTLTKTFAHLPIGLAIFDAHRQLQIFNPALLDLTTLPVEFLSARPTLAALLDAMRERHMIPEPKDYRSWRRQMSELEKAAQSGLYDETWSLPGGQTYRVLGRPHPNGALAFLIEDISTEMMQTRRYRADLELSQSVFDSLDEAIAVFSPAGALVLTNEAYAQLWGHDPAEIVSDAGVRSLVRWWRDHSAPSILWDDVESYVGVFGARDPWTGEVRLRDGRMVSCRVHPLAGGATLVGFRVQRPEGGVVRAVASDDPGRLRA